MHYIIYCEQRSGSTFFENRLFSFIPGMEGYDKEMLAEFFRDNDTTLNEYFEARNKSISTTVRVKPYRCKSFGTHEFNRLNQSADCRIVLKRRDIWDHAISIYIAMVTSYKYATTDSLSDRDKIKNRLDGKKMSQEKMLSIYNGILHSNSILDSLPDIDHVIYYEDFVDNPRHYLKMLTDNDREVIKLFSLEEKEKMFTNTQEVKSYVIENYNDLKKDTSNG